MQALLHHASLPPGTGSWGQGSLPRAAAIRSRRTAGLLWSLILCMHPVVSRLEAGGVLKGAPQLLPRIVAGGHSGERGMQREFT